MLADIIAALKEKIVIVKNPDGSAGTGIALDAFGVIVTNSHVVAGAGIVGIETNDDRSFLARVITSSKRIDYAFLSCRGLSFPSYPVLSPRERLREGEDVVAIGHPYGLEFTVSKGIVSSAGREIGGVRFIQTDVPINPGNSGGPLLDEAGEIVGINTWIVSNAQGLSFAIPAAYIREAYARLPAADTLDSGSYCVSCGGFSPIKERWCSFCGVEVNEPFVMEAIAAGTGYCVSCATANPPEETYCKKCGATLPVEPKPPESADKTKETAASEIAVVCPACGRENKGGKYCVKCGSTLGLAPF